MTYEQRLSAEQKIADLWKTFQRTRDPHLPPQIAALEVALDA